MKEYNRKEDDEVGTQYSPTNSVGKGPSLVYPH